MPDNLSAADFEARFGREPQQDDLARVNCAHAGHVGHWGCGVCETHNCPCYQCGCRLTPTSPDPWKSANA